MKYQGRRGHSRFSTSSTSNVSSKDREGKGFPAKKGAPGGRCCVIFISHFDVRCIVQSKPPCTRFRGRRVHGSKCLFEINHADSSEQQFDNPSQTGPPLTLESEVFPWKESEDATEKLLVTIARADKCGREKREGAVQAIREGLLDNITCQNKKVPSLKKKYRHSINPHKLLSKSSSLG